MVGDWVLLFDETPVRVDCIGNIEVYLTEPRGQHDLDWRVTYEHIKPIPLTPEILEKNGFEDVGDGIVQFVERPYYVWFVPAQYELGIEEGITTTEEIGTKIVLNIPCLYVHELQRALKVCGIDKTIVL